MDKVPWVFFRRRVNVGRLEGVKEGGNKHSKGASLLRRFGFSMPVVAMMAAASVGAAEAQVQRSFLNLGFEEPVITCGYALVPSLSVLGWDTTHTNATGNCGFGSGKLIEIWQSGNKGVPSRAGDQHAELNALEDSRVFQSVCLVGGDEIEWKFSHHGLEGSDVMEFNIGNTSRVVRATTDDTGSGTDSNCGDTGTISSATCTSAQAGVWRDYSGTFTWTGASGIQQFGFEVVSSSNGNPDNGNLLDEIQLQIRPFVEFTQETTGNAESGAATNLPQISVSGHLDAPISVNVNVTGGTATLTDDFTTPSGSSSFIVEIPAGTYAGTSFDIGVSVIEDALSEADETIEFEIAEDPAYILSSTRSCGDTAFSRSTHTIQEEKLEITKTATLNDGDGVASAGDTISYAFTITNTGLVDLSDIMVTDPIPGVAVTGGPITLAAGASDGASFTASYEITQADVDAGRFGNQASASGMVAGTGLVVDDLSDDPNNDADVDTESDGEPDDPTVVLLAAAGAYTVEKSSILRDDDLNGRSDVGEVIEYTFTVTNTGNVTLSDIEVTDENATVSGGPIATLAPGETNSTVTGTYTLTQADIDAGQVENVATSTAKDPGDDPVTADTTPPGGSPGDPTVTPLLLQGGMDLLKEGEHQDADGDGVIDVGETILYTFRVENTGNVTLTDVIIEDAKVEMTGGPLASLPPGGVDETTFTGLYEVTQADADAGFVENAATATAKTPGGDETTANSHSSGGEPGDPTRVVIPGAAALQLSKTSSFDLADDTNGNGFPDAGELVRYTFEVVNTGNVTISDIVLDDPGVDVSGGPIAALAANGTDAVTFTGKRMLTQAEVDAGETINQATVRGEAPTGNPVEDLSDDPADPADRDLEDDGEPDDPTVLLLEQNLSLSLQKAGSFEGAVNGEARPGDRILYTFTVTNDGNVSATDVTPQDPGPRFNGKPATGSLSAFTPAQADIGPGNSETFTASYTLTEADIANAQNVEDGVQNTATVGGTGPKGDQAESPEATAVVDLPGFLIMKTADLSEVRRGDRVGYTIRVEGIGFTSPETVNIIDSFPVGFAYVPGSVRVAGAAVTPQVDGRRITIENVTLTPNEPLEVMLDMTVTAAAKPGTYINQAWVEEPDGRVVSRIAKAEVEVVMEPVFDCGDVLGKVFDDSNRNGYQDEGETGLPGVRVASVKGLLITSDAHGRFHVACADLPDQRIGTNYLLKLDPRSLPSGYRLTTENPRVIRLTAGKASQFQFGASIGRVVRLDLGDGAFEPGEHQLRADWSSRVDQLIALLDQEPSILRLSYVGDNKRLAMKRLKTVRRMIARQWRGVGSRYRLEIEMRVRALHTTSYRRQID